MDIRDWIVDLKATCGERFLVTGVRPRYEYVDGKRTDKVSGYNYACVCAARNYAAINVFVPGDRMLDDDTLARNAAIRFEGLLGRPYVSNDGRPALAISATAVSAVKA